MENTIAQVTSTYSQETNLNLNQEFAGISPEVLALNVRFVNDIEYDPITKEGIATPIADALNLRYTRFGQNTQQNLTAALFIGEDGQTWQAKIFGDNAQQWLTRYQHQGKRTGQYLAPKGIGDKPYLPTIPKAIIYQIAAQYQLEPPAEEESVWVWLLLHPEIPIIITEGAKKALAAISQGYIALSLFGCNCGVKDLKVKPELLPYVEGRQVTIAFDRDLKGETRYKVFKATKRLGSALTHDAKSKVQIASWDGTQGKGIDDLISHAPHLFHQAIETAKNFDDWRLGQYTDLSVYNPITLNQRYLNLNLPENARLIALKSPKGTGKTEWIAQQVAAAIAQGIPIIVLSHREQLVKELSSRFGIAYRTELKELGQGKQLGYGLCIDSLHPNANPSFDPESWEGCWVILDEVEQVFWHLLNSRTCQHNRVPILETLTHLLNVSERIFIADADLSKISLDYVTRLLDEPVIPWLVVNEWRPTTPKRALVYNSPESLLSDMMEAIRNGDRLLVHTGAQKVSSRWGTINLESLIKITFPDLNILRIDAESVADPLHPAYGCMSNLNGVVARYDVVIASPTLETGVSIDIKHFHRVFCFAVGSQTVEAVGQGLERYRHNVPRHIWIKERSNQRIGNGSDNLRSLIKSQDKLFKTNCYYLGQVDALSEIDDDHSSQHLKTWATLAALKNYGFKNYRKAVLELLKADGYHIEEIEETEGQQAMKEEIKAIADANYQAHCEQVSQAPILDDLSYQRVKDKRTKTETERLSEKKTAIAKRYLTEEVTTDMVKADDNGFYGQIQLHYYLTIGNAFLKQRDTKKVDKITANGKSQAFVPDINETCLAAQVLALKAIGIEQFFDQEREFTSDGLQEWFDSLHQYRQDIKTYLNQTVNAEKDTPIAVAQRLLRTIGLKLTCIGQRTIDGKRQRVYKMMNLNLDDRNAIFDRWLERDQQASLHTPSINSNYIVRWPPMLGQK